MSISHIVSKDVVNQTLAPKVSSKDTCTSSHISLAEANHLTIPQFRWGRERPSLPEPRERAATKAIAVSPILKHWVVYLWAFLLTHCNI